MFNFQRNLIAPTELKRLLPLTKEQIEIKKASDLMLVNAIENRDKYLVVCGPCAADNYEAVVEYCKMLKKLSDKVNDKILICPRIFTAKPRSRGEGYLGMMFEQNSSGETDINKGLIECRKLFLECMSITQLPLADELLYFEQYGYFDDVVSYLFIGARTSESTPHRNFASGVDVPVGIKNPAGGNLKSLAEALYCVKNPKICLFNENQYLTSGNNHAHIVLRGQINEDGTYVSNCNENSIKRLCSYCGELNISKPFILMDCSHANSGKYPKRQIENAIFCVENLPKIGGIMLESYINEGNSETAFGTSRTDPCLSFTDTESLILKLYSSLSK